LGAQAVLSDRCEIGLQVNALERPPTALRHRMIGAVPIERATLGVGEHERYLLGLSPPLSRSLCRLAERGRRLPDHVGGEPDRDSAQYGGDSEVPPGQWSAVAVRAGVEA
jgi:hypothetical protein